MSTSSTDLVFRPKVWSDHVSVFRDRKMGLGQLALKDNTLVAEPGETVNFPYYKAIGDAQEPAEDEGLEVRKLADDSFACTVKEVGNAVGWKDKAKRVSGDKKGGVEEEAQAELGRTLAEKVDKDLILTINANGASSPGFLAAANTDKASVKRLLTGNIKGFGDKSEQTIAYAMHSMDYLNMMTDSDSGFLKADANHPFYQLPGFMGTILGKALFVLDTMPEVPGGLHGKKAYYHFAFKANPFGIYTAEEMAMEKDRDILKRENVVAATMWYGMLSLHGKVSANDKRILKGAFVQDDNI